MLTPPQSGHRQHALQCECFVIRETNCCHELSTDAPPHHLRRPERKREASSPVWAARDMTRSHASHLQMQSEPLSSNPLSCDQHKQNREPLLYIFIDPGLIFLVIKKMALWETEASVRPLDSILILAAPPLPLQLPPPLPPTAQPIMSANLWNPRAVFDARADGPKWTGCCQHGTFQSFQGPCVVFYRLLYISSLSLEIKPSLIWLPVLHN